MVVTFLIPVNKSNFWEKGFVLDYSSKKYNISRGDTWRDYEVLLTWHPQSGSRETKDGAQLTVSFSVSAGTPA